MRRVEWLRWMVRYGRPKTRIRQIGAFLAFEFYYQFCKLRGYGIDHVLQTKSPPTGKYLVMWPPLPLSIRLLNKIVPFGDDAHAKYVPYTSAAAEEMRNMGKRIELVEISYNLGVTND